jgi:hypothetical protein
MIYRTMGAEERDNAEEVEILSTSFGSSNGPEKGLVFEEGAVLNRPVNPQTIRIDPSPGADVQMPNF